MLAFFISLISGALLAAAFPKLNLAWTAWLAMAPLIIFTFSLPMKRALACGMAFGLGFFGVLLHWISIFGTLPWIALCIYQSLFFVLFVAVSRLIGGRLGSWGRLILLPSLWVLTEYLRASGLFGFTWGDIGYSQSTILPIVQLSSVTGIYGVSFLIALVNTGIANLLLVHFSVTEGKASRRGVGMQGSAGGDITSSRVGLVACIAMVLCVFTFGSVQLRQQIPRDGLILRAAVIQGNVSEDIKNFDTFTDSSWQAYDSLTREAAGRGANFIVWPETVVPGCVGTEPFVQSRLQSIARNWDADLLVGGWDERGPKQYNSAFLIDRRLGVVGKYAKTHLVPFGEFVPARKYLPFLQYFRVRSCDTSPGDGFKIMDNWPYRIGTAICFESAFPEALRTMTGSGADVLCVITDDEWFGRSAAAEQHLAMSVFRAAENRRYLLRAAASGYSAVIDPYGRVVAVSGIFSPAMLRQDVWTQSFITSYTRFGDWVVYLCGALVISSVVATLRKKRKK
jgi:apolipoprotein N-acyltransferase